MAQASNLPPCQLSCKQWGKMTHQRLLEEGKPKHRGPRGVGTRANWQVSHQCWLSTALACLPGGGDNGWEAAMCFT